jgi:hypothetical protein
MSYPTEGNISRDENYTVLVSQQSLFNEICLNQEYPTSNHTYHHQHQPYQQFYDPSLIQHYYQPNSVSYTSPIQQNMFPVFMEYYENHELGFNL